MWVWSELTVVNKVMRLSLILFTDRREGTSCIWWYLCKILVNSTEVRLLSQTDKLLACHCITILLWNPIIHYHVHKSLPRNHILRHFHMHTVSVTSVLLLSFRLHVSLRSLQTFRYNFFYAFVISCIQTSIFSISFDSVLWYRDWHTSTTLGECSFVSFSTASLTVRHVTDTPNASHHTHFTR